MTNIPGTYQLLFISIYYSEDEWHALLKDTLNEYLNESNSKFCFNWVIHFSKAKGDNISLTIKVDKSYSDTLLESLTNRVSSYLDENPSLPNDVLIESRPLFENFHNNTIQYGAHRHIPLLDNSFSEEYFMIWDKSSRLLLSELNDPFRSQDLANTAFYLYLSLIIQNEFFRRFHIENYKPKINSQIDRKRLNEFQFRYQENETVIDEIVEECALVLHGHDVSKLAWVKHWVNIFDQFINRAITQSISKDHILYKSICLDLKKQLYVNFEGMMLFDFFINKILNKNYDSLQLKD